ncbi:UNVERIFIED_CONTAM: hypothetical protein K2H54_057430 [Gekko kuhli]
MGFMVTDGSTNIRAAAQALGISEGQDQQEIDGHGHGAKDTSLEAGTMVAGLGMTVGGYLQCHSYQEEGPQSLGCTHWNSTYTMLERLVEQKRALTFLISETEAVWEENQINQDEWLTISQTVGFIKPFKDYTVALI